MMELANLTPLPMTHVAARLLLASAAGLVVGLEREVRGRPAGLRTTMLACVGAAAGVILADRIYDNPSRVLQGILTGIGFLGAGAITRDRRAVHGLTTAAVLWVSTILGLIFGAGLWELGLIVLALMMFILIVLRKGEKHLPRDWQGTLTITIQMSGATDTEIKDRLEAAHLSVKHVCLDYDLQNRQRTLKCDIHTQKQHSFKLAEQVVSDLALCKGVMSVNWTNE